MLWLNGRDLLIVNETAADFIEAFIEVMSHYPEHLDTGKFKKEVAARMQQRYPDIPKKVLIRDFDSTYSTLVAISNGSCPIHDMSLDVKETHPELWTAPPRMDLALTYRCNNNCSFCYTGGPQAVPE